MPPASNGSDEHDGRALTAIAARPELRNSEVAFVRSDGAAFTLLLNAKPLLDSSAGVIGYAITLSDITERQHREAQLRQAQAAVEHERQAGRRRWSTMPSSRPARPRANSSRV